MSNQFNKSTTMLDDGNQLVVSQELDDNGESNFVAKIINPDNQIIIFKAADSVLDNLMHTPALADALKQCGMTDGAVLSMAEKMLKFDFSIPISDDVSLDIGGNPADESIHIGIDIKF